jgi:hypothetical protein
VAANQQGCSAGKDDAFAERPIPRSRAVSEWSLVAGQIQKVQGLGESRQARWRARSILRGPSEIQLPELKDTIEKLGASNDSICAFVSKSQLFDLPRSVLRPL